MGQERSADGYEGCRETYSNITSFEEIDMRSRPSGSQQRRKLANGDDDQR